MTAQPTRDQLRALAREAHYWGGVEQELGDALIHTLDQLAAAEQRITRLEAQTDIRGRAVVMYRERAREADARIRAVEDVLDKVEAGESWFRPVDFSGTPFPITVDTSDIRRALDT